ncbi:MAG: helix-turn-helix transcriptional regulator [Nitrososphaerota archaeon]|nr:helix-turn-helix transcriptional regulator [Nitrososphaerota archaeon]MDG6949912.1 helix-turn-helix transcriptional regulator [Nitrososphaerota archaeon]MDG6961645.1 helix-turn-helix transcriptional regulator [Nitrososphaerota archaeon]MDG6972816.1 helix-turn-helix transcriptional regulator [Nitrososphaerota archaeon]MDG6980483.1 helix-turn-helix transcriptional regulator [Nitrososphaerota archaeon]
MLGRRACGQAGQRPQDFGGGSRRCRASPGSSLPSSPSRRECSVGSLSKSTEIPQADLSQHLAVLRQQGLLETRRKGTTIFYSVSDSRIVEACDLVRECIGERLRRAQLVLAASR